MLKKLSIIALLFLPIFSFGQDNIAFVNSSFEGKKLLKEKTPTDVFESNFELHDRMIFVEAELNGIKGKYILDTGSPMLLINKKPLGNESIVGGISKNCKGEIVGVREFVWAGISNKSIEAIAIDLTSLEKSVGTSIAGLIGQNIFRNYELYLDVSNKIIQLHKTRKSKLHKNRDYKKKINFNMQGHIPVVTLKINGVKYKFGIDTGSEVNVINKNLMKELEGDLYDFQSSQLVGVDGLSQNLASATLPNFQIKGEQFNNLKFLLMDFTSLEKNLDLELDGILGYPFLSQIQMSINYKKRKIYLW